MQIPPEEIQSLINDAQYFAHRSKRPSLNRMIANHRSSMRKEIAEQIQGEMVLLDESLRFVIAFEKHQSSLRTNEVSSILAIQAARLRSDLISLRELITLGQESAALAIARVFVEDLELCMAICADSEFAVAYANSENHGKFWADNIGYGKIYRKVEAFIRLGDLSAEEITSMLKYHKELKNFLSSHIHPTFQSAFHVAHPPSIRNPGMFANRPFGAISSYISPLCLYVAKDIHTFSACSINVFISDSPPPALAGYRPSRKLADVIHPAHVLQELVVKYFDEFWNAYEVQRDEWQEVLDAEAK